MHDNAATSERWKYEGERESGIPKQKRDEQEEQIECLYPPQRDSVPYQAYGTPRLVRKTLTGLYVVFPNNEWLHLKYYEMSEASMKNNVIGIEFQSCTLKIYARGGKKLWPMVDYINQGLTSWIMVARPERDFVEDDDGAYIKRIVVERPDGSKIDTDVQGYAVAAPTRSRDDD